MADTTIKLSGTYDSIEAYELLEEMRGVASDYLPLTGGEISGDLIVDGQLSGTLTGNVTGNVTGTASGNLPLSGGTMTGNIILSDNYANIATDATNKYLRFMNLDYNGGASLYLYGSTYNSADAGSFVFNAYDGTNRKTLRGKSDGSLAWDSYNVITDNIVTANMTLTSNFEQYTSGDTTNAIRAGNVVTVVGVLKPKSNIASGSSTTMFTLPSGYRPTRTLRFIQQGSGITRWLLEIESGGDVKISRYGTTSDSQIAAGQWLPITATFVTTNAWPS